MVLERVKSKNLFNFRPQGFVDEDIEVYENEKRALRAKQGDFFFIFHQKNNNEWTVLSLDFFCLLKNSHIDWSISLLR